MEFIAVWNGFTVLKDCDGNFVVENSSSVFITEEQAFKACMIGDVQ